ncbi:hypothetical protein AQUCO_03100001v1 [Aquilegia coerulea]|uniref:Uncharacterized protein n=1 Tax=Aquilegia coerulea TaxID=218851 RepID=A0A2G5D0C0_AQUCA|nr:hypothetical protein AQUCO_03100001v1 [Aquilegia coerulea]
MKENFERLEDENDKLKKELNYQKLKSSLMLKNSELLLALKETDSRKTLLKLAITEGQLKDLQAINDDLKCKLAAEISGGTSHESNKDKGSNEGSISHETRDKETIILRNESEVSGLLIDGGMEEYVAPEVSGLLVDGENDGYVDPEVSGMFLDEGFAFRKVQNMESDHVTIPDLVTVEADTDKSKRELSTLSKEEEILGNSMGASFTPVSCRTRSHTRGMETQNASLESPKTTQVPKQPGSQASDMAHKPEMMESRTQKRKNVENISFPGSPRSKVLKLDSCPILNGQKRVSRLSQVEILKASMGNLTPILNPTTTRAQTRSLERAKSSNRRQTHGMTNQKTSLDIPKTSRVRRPVIAKKPEVTDSRTRKRKQVEKDDAPRFSTSNVKAPKLKNTSPHTAY